MRLPRPRRLAVAATVLAAAGCGSGDPAAPSPAVMAVSVAPDSLVLPAIGASLRLLVTAAYADGRSADVTTAASTAYTSEQSGIAGVGGGIVSAAGAGETRVIASFAGMSDTVVAIVDEGAAIAVSSLATEPAGEIELLLGATAVVRAAAVWENGARLERAGLPFVYESSDEAVASVTPNGLVSARGSGGAVLTVRYRDRSVEIAVVVAQERLLTFDSDVYPILLARCGTIACHPGAPAATPQRGLRLNSYANVMAGGVNGPVVVPRDPASSRLVLALRGVLTSTQRMPLGGALSNRDIGIIEDWIAQGACRSEGDCPASGGEDGFARQP